MSMLELKDNFLDVDFYPDFFENIDSQVLFNYFDQNTKFNIFRNKKHKELKRLMEIQI